MEGTSSPVGDSMSQVDFQAKKIRSLLVELESVGADKFALLLRLNGIAAMLGVAPPQIEEEIKLLIQKQS